MNGRADARTRCRTEKFERSVGVGDELDSPTAKLRAEVGGEGRRKRRRSAFIGEAL